MPAALPVLFISHGSPMFALEPGLAGARLTELGRRLPPIEAVLVVSPHWMTSGGVRILAGTDPETIHDFGGFPRALYALRYPVKGQPALAARAQALLREAGFEAVLDARRGLDHGAWVPLMHLLPDARVPVFQVSLPHPCSTADAWRLGHALAPLREAGVLIVGSGSLTHNLYEIQASGSAAAGYAVAFAQWVREAVCAKQVEALIDYRQRVPHAVRAHPTEEHFLPLLVALGAADMADVADTADSGRPGIAAGAGEPVEIIEGGITHGVLSMDSYLFGELA